MCIQSKQVHNKAVYDFSFLGSSSFLATAGFSSENKNVCLWDTLMHPKSCMVHCKYQEACDSPIIYIVILLGHSQNILVLSLYAQVQMCTKLGGQGKDHKEGFNFSSLVRT